MRESIETRKGQLPLLAAIVLLLGMIAAGLLPALRLTGGRLAYPIDDVYLHMAIAKNFSQHAVWNFTPEGYSSGTSAPIWTLLIAAIFLVAGVHQVIPLIIGILSAVAVLAGAHWILKKYSPEPVVNFAVLAAIAVLTPLPALALSGMEHAAQALLDLVLVYWGARTLAHESDETSGQRDRIDSGLLLIAALVTAIRFEGLFLTFVLTGLFFLRGRFRSGIILGAVSAAPVVIYGMISISKGWYFLPTSVLLKGNSPPLHGPLSGLLFYAFTFWRQLRAAPHLSVLLLFALLLLGVRISRRQTWTTASMMLVVFVCVTILHLQFAALGWFYRYEAYLIPIGIIALALALLPELPGDFWRRGIRGAPQYAALGAGAILALTPLAERAFEAMKITPACIYNIYEQQVQMSLFLKRFYRGASVAANDIGAINFFADIRCLDLAGLASVEVAQARRESRFHKKFIREFSLREHVSLAVVYEKWFPGAIPDQWIRVGTWSISDNHILGDATVSFFSVGDLARAETLAARLRQFRKRLPATVTQEILFSPTAAPVISETLGEEADADGAFWWTTKSAQIAMQLPEGSSGRTLVIPVAAYAPRVTLHFSIEDKIIESRTITPADKWVAIPLRADWGEGKMVIRVVGEGEAMQPPHDSRFLLFAIRRPSWSGDESK